MWAVHDPCSLLILGKTLMQTDKRESEGFFCHLGFSLLVGSPWCTCLTCFGNRWIMNCLHNSYNTFPWTIHCYPYEWGNKLSRHPTSPLSMPVESKMFWLANYNNCYIFRSLLQDPRGVYKILLYYLFQRCELISRDHHGILVMWNGMVDRDGGKENEWIYYKHLNYIMQCKYHYQIHLILYF